MESKNIKVIDEHGIDRVANIICSIDVDGSDYVVYWIERDNDNDNLFVSKLIKNNDMTSNMVNIEDSVEKSKITDIVKGLVTYAVNTQTDKNGSGVVTLPNGKEVKISSVMFNKEQNINVQKTYITTVKKAITKVSSDFYVVEKKPEVVAEPEVIVQPFIQPVKEEVPEVELPTLENTTENASSNVEINATNAEVQPVVEPVTEPVVEPVTEPEVKVETPVLEVSTPTTTIPEPVVSTPAPEPIAPAVETVQQVESVPSVAPSAPAPEVPKVEQVSPMVSQNVTPVNDVQVAPAEPTPIASVPPVNPEPVTPVNNPSQPEKLVFDGSKESNLNGALSETFKVDNNIAVGDVQAIRDFGIDTQVSDNVQFNDAIPAVKRSSGFANNKFFMVIAVVFFLASCVFLGYEVFRYFQIVGK